MSKLFRMVVASGILAACGGNVVVDAVSSSSSSSSSSGSGSGGAQTSSSSSSSSSSAGACIDGCPAVPPGAGTACMCEGMTCPYNDCAADGPITTATCIAERWSVQIVTCGLGG